MIQPLPDGLHAFLAATPWQGAEIAPLAGDASFRRYFRLRHDGATAMLMHAPPPHEDPRPFLDVAGWLEANGLRAPRILLADPAAGWVLTEDFGDVRVKERLDAHPREEQAIYSGAVDALIALRAVPPGPFAAYDMAAYLRETALFTEWFCPAAGLEVDGAGWHAAWEEVLSPLLARQAPGVTVLRDYHAENIMLLAPGDPRGEQGLIDFQDALVGHPAYDLVSLLQDARRDVSPATERAMLERYCANTAAGDNFEADYLRLGAQRNAKIVGIFTRLARRDGKARYLDLIPRVWSHLERDLAHPALAPVARWFDANVPLAVRVAQGDFRALAHG